MTPTPPLRKKEPTPTLQPCFWQGVTQSPYKDDPPLPTLTQLGQMAGGIPLRWEGLVPLPAAPFAFPLGAGGGHHHDFLRRWPHAVGFCSHQREGWALAWWGEEMESNWLLLPRNPVWRCSSRVSTSPGSTDKCISEMRWPRWTEPLKSWVSVSRWTPTSPSALTPATVSSVPRGPAMSWKPSLGRTGASRLKSWWPVCLSSWTTPPLSGSPKCPPCRTNRRWCRTRL